MIQLVIVTAKQILKPEDAYLAESKIIGRSRLSRNETKTTEHPTKPRFTLRWYDCVFFFSALKLNPPPPLP